MEFFPFFQKLLLGLLVLFVGNAAINRTDLNALFGIVGTYTLGTLLRVYDIDSFRLGNSLVGALRLAGSATYTLICNL